MSEDQTDRILATERKKRRMKRERERVKEERERGRR